MGPDDSRRCHYDVLGVKKDSTDKEIKQAYVELSKKLHPDVSQDPNNHNRFIQLQQAYQTLIKSDSRRDYDRGLARPRRGFTDPGNVARAAAHSHREWHQNRPGGPQYQKDYYEHFWDETIYGMHNNKSRDQTYRPQSRYYGTPYPMKRMSNGIIVAGCVAFIGIGAILHYFAVKSAHNITREMLDKRDKINHGFHKNAKIEAMKNGNERQLELLKLKIEGSSRPEQ